MAKQEVSAAIASLKELLSGDDDIVREAVRGYVQDVLEEEMTAALGGTVGGAAGLPLGLLRARPGDACRAYRVARAAGSRGSLFDGSVRALPALGESPGLGACGDVRAGVSTRKVKRITEELCGHALSASVISSIVKRLDAQLQAFARRRLSEPFP